MEVVKNTEGKTVLPQSQYDPLDPVNGAVYVKDEEFEQIKASQATASSDNPKVDTQPQTGSETTSSEPTPSIDYDAIVKEKTGGKFEKWDDLQKVIDTPATPALDIDDNTKQIIENLKEGKYNEVTNFLIQQQILGGLDKMDAADVLKYKMQLENPDFTEEDIEDEFERKYAVGVDPTDVDEKEYKKLQRRAERQLDVDAKAARAELGKLKTELKLPSFQQQQPAQAAGLDPETEQTINEINNLAENFSKGIDKSISQFTKLDLSIQDKDVQFSHEYGVDDNERADLGSKAKDYFGYLQSRYYKDDQYDTQKLSQDIFIIENFQKILKSAVTRAINLGKIDVAKGVANITDQRNPSTNNFADDRRKGAEEFAYS